MKFVDDDDNDRVTYYGRTQLYICKETIQINVIHSKLDLLNSFVRVQSKLNSIKAHSREDVGLR